LDPHKPTCKEWAGLILYGFYYKYSHIIVNIIPIVIPASQIASMSSSAELEEATQAVRYA
jgi:hypothetical protein